MQAKRIVMTAGCFLPVVLIYGGIGTAPQGATRLREIAYQADDAVFPNPERGFYMAFNPPGRDNHKRGVMMEPHAPLRVDVLRSLRDRPEAITLVRDVIRIGKFWDADLSTQRLSEIETDWDAVRRAGLKVIPRFVYSWGIDNSDPGEARAIAHIRQLRALFQRNADVIAWVQGGFFGGCGEGNASEHFVYDGWDNGTRKWQKLNEAGVRVYKALLESSPKERMVAVRYPRFKWDLLGWPPQAARPLTAEQAFQGSVQARIGYHDDGFMGNAEHYAMFQLLGEADFAAADSAFVVFEGEISDASQYKLQPRQVVSDMERYHQTALNMGGDDWSTVCAAWKRNGDYDVICRRMGYRLRMLHARMAVETQRGASLPLQIEIKNEGFGPVYNPRLLEVILRNRGTGQLYGARFGVAQDIRLWLPGPGETKILDLTAGIPPAMPMGDYEVLLALPDPAPRLFARPEYNIRLASQGVWEPSTGFNRLLGDVRVTSGAASSGKKMPVQFSPRQVPR